MSNIIPFPSREQLAKERDELVVDIALDLSLGVFQRIDLISDGLDLAAYRENTEQDMMLIHEAIKSCLLRLTGRPHNLQRVAEEIDMSQIKELKFETNYIDDEYEDE